jgi:hypothetical protein
MHPRRIHKHRMKRVAHCEFTAALTDTYGARELEIQVQPIPIKKAVGIGAAVVGTRGERVWLGPDEITVTRDRRHRDRQGARVHRGAGQRRLPVGLVMAHGCRGDANASRSHCAVKASKRTVTEEQP